MKERIDLLFLDVFFVLCLWLLFIWLEKKQVVVDVWKSLCVVFHSNQNLFILSSPTNIQGTMSAFTLLS